MIDAMSCMMDLWSAALGTCVGPTAGAAVKSMITIWEHKDPGCSRWGEFYPGHQPGVLSVMRHLVFPRLFRWSVSLWSALISADALPEHLSILLTPAKLKAEVGGDIYDVYRQNAVRAQTKPQEKRAQGQTGSAAGKETKKPKKTCSFCGKNGHVADDCWELQALKEQNGFGKGTNRNKKKNGKGKGRSAPPPANWDTQVPNYTPPFMPSYDFAGGGYGGGNGFPGNFVGGGGGSGHFQSPPFTPPQQFQQQFIGFAPKVCHNCGDPSHMIKDCPWLRTSNKGKGKGKGVTKGMQEQPVIHFLQDATSPGPQQGDGTSG
jgi:hypothetical protein